MNFAQRLNIFILISLSILSLSLSVYGYLLYSINKFNNSVAKINKELETNLSMETTRSSVKIILKSTEEERAKLDTYFIDVKGIPRFLEALGNFSKDAGISLSLNSIDIENASALRVNFNAQGTFKNLFHFLILLEASPYALEIGNLNLNKINVSVDKQVEMVNQWSGSGTIRLISFVNG